MYNFGPSPQGPFTRLLFSICFGYWIDGITQLAEIGELRGAKSLFEFSGEPIPRWLEQLSVDTAKRVIINSGILATDENICLENENLILDACLRHALWNWEYGFLPHFEDQLAEFQFEFFVLRALSMAEWSASSPRKAVVTVMRSGGGFPEWTNDGIFHDSDWSNPDFRPTLKMWEDVLSLDLPLDVLQSQLGFGGVQDLIPRSQHETLLTLCELWAKKHRTAQALKISKIARLPRRGVKKSTVRFFQMAESANQLANYGKLTH